MDVGAGVGEQEVTRGAQSRGSEKGSQSGLIPERPALCWHGRGPVKIGERYPFPYRGGESPTSGGSVKRPKF